MATNARVFVPFRSDNAEREENWLSIKSLHWDKVPWVSVIEGASPEGQFNISAARNDAATKGGNWSFAVFCDADSFIDANTLETAIELSMKTGQVVIPHSRWVNVSVRERDNLLRHGWLPFNPKRSIVNGTKGSLYVVPRSAYDAVNGFDERFVGWGWEDTAFHLAVETLYKPIIQFEGNIWHLEHERPSGDVNRGTDPYAIANRNHFQTYKRARSVRELQKVINGNMVS